MTTRIHLPVPCRRALITMRYDGVAIPAVVDDAIDWKAVRDDYAKALGKTMQDDETVRIKVK